MTDKLAAFAGQPTVSPVFAQNGNSPWAQRYAQELTDVVLRYAARLPRSTQRHLGPSELGHACSRQVTGKMAGVKFGSSAGAIGGTYAWASIMGTAMHAFLEQAFAWDASQPGPNFGRWLTEHRVCPDPGAGNPHPGTADLYDTLWVSCGDHKGMSTAVRTRLRKDGPPLHYFLQLLFYAIGYMNEGRDVRRIVLISWPRTESTLSDLYVWAHEITNDDLRLAVEYLEKTKVREEAAALIVQNRATIWDIPATPSDDECQFCPFSNPAALEEGTDKGCPGTSMLRPGFHR